jgi:protein-S-isoprenylcysteine O-methyltransferase Ste14
VVRQLALDELILNFSMGFLFAYATLASASWIEKRFIDKRAIQNKGKIIENRTLQFFRYIKWITVLSIALEFAVTKTGVSVVSFVLGSLLFTLGLSLRIVAIKTLGEFWSYHIEIKPNHRIVRSGIYRYIRHPAYLGNIYLVGVCLIPSCYVSAFMALILVGIFGYKRSLLENRVLTWVDGQRISWTTHSR